MATWMLDKDKGQSQRMYASSAAAGQVHSLGTGHTVQTGRGEGGMGGDSTLCLAGRRRRRMSACAKYSVRGCRCVGTVCRPGVRLDQEVLCSCSMYYLTYEHGVCVSASVCV